MKPISKSKIQTSVGTMEYALSGEGSPAVILINGGSGPIEGWMRTFHEMAGHTRTLAYNRLGVGGSAKPDRPQDGRTIVATLRELLQKLGISPPYVLVGHSLGGLYANLFARLHPDEIAGVVLLEASHPEDLIINQTQGAVVKGLNRMLGMFDRFFPDRQWSETHFVEETAKQIAAAGPFPDVPLIVLSGGKRPPMMPEDAFAIRQRNQLDYARMNGRGEQRIAFGSGHFPQMTEPETVRQAVADCVAAARELSRTPQ
ncbi:alpha/beta fold hydrolase [Paenibacillus methanolicus]|uniref:Pimeloyl-ACP methyl ester carboxylesterase n=1 Tax=Paenibacillus methanolicus TaxID=582686 RepID=A0A5S5C6G8_9BACL|nr:alpha/beta hydrolase [Paenibacillus methanolicus]TYP74072.1 pimeloyl-ACP methyl ester carboxylesterase [Paenibacillus methanolicus]